MYSVPIVESGSSSSQTVSLLGTFLFLMDITMLFHQPALLNNSSLIFFIYLYTYVGTFVKAFLSIHLRVHREIVQFKVENEIHALLVRLVFALVQMGALYVCSTITFSRQHLVLYIRLRPVSYHFIPGIIFCLR